MENLPKVSRVMQRVMVPVIFVLSGAMFLVVVAQVIFRFSSSASGGGSSDASKASHKDVAKLISLPGWNPAKWSPSRAS